MVFLPAISKRICLISANETFVIVMMGEAIPTGADQVPLSGYSGLQWDGDYVRMSSKSGDLFVGLSGEDKKLVDPKGWKKFSLAFQSAVQSVKSSDESRSRSA
jgi:hypothetical protein